MGAFTNKVETILPGFGTASVVASLVGSSLTATATKSVTIAPTISRGFIHVRQSAANAATTAQFQVTVTDGTTTYTVLEDSAARGAGHLADLIIPFCTDLSVNSVSVIATLGGATTTTTLDIEVAGNP